MHAVSLTTEGHRELEKIDVAYDALYALTNGALPSHEREQFCALAAKLIAALDAATAASPEKADGSGEA